MFVLGSSSSSGVRLVTRRWLYDQMQQPDLVKLDQKLDYLENHFISHNGDSEDDLASLRKRFSYFKTAIKEKWAKSHRKEDVFLKMNESWLDGTFELPTQTLLRPGRPAKSFEDSSERSKRRKTEELRSNTADELLIHAAQTTLRQQGHRNASNMLKEITNTPTLAGKYKKASQAQDCKECITPLTPLQALTMFVEADLTKRQYEIIRNTNKALYPCYNRLLQAKQECYPPKECLRVTSTCAESSLQSLLDNTVTRLSVYLADVLITLNEERRNSLSLICKWGCDGSQQSKYKQRFEDADDSDANLFLSSFVPLRIICGKDNKYVVWQNPTPSSPRFCRPIRFRFLKESTDITKEEIDYVKNSSNSLVASEVQLNGAKFSFTHVMKMTMIDGKVCNAATDTKSTSRCYICGATSKDFNNLSKKNEICPESLEFGLSILHARIRLFESILHLAYKLPVKKYRQRRTESEKKLEADAKKNIQKRFEIETGLQIDKPKANFGNTNDGNTSRRFFENPELASDITGVDFNLIYRVKVILETISSGHKIDTKKYDAYALETAKLYVDKYGWHPMTPTMHKILIHGATIIENSLLPIGQLSEEAQEARNKHFRKYRENFARKFSREECNKDIYYRLLLSSDPLISCMNRSAKKNYSKAFCPETIAILLSAEPNEAPEFSDNEDNE